MMKMAEVERKTEEEKRELLGERKDDEEEDQVEGKDLDLELELERSTSSVLASLNLVMILSSLSLSPSSSSDEESSLNLEERESGRRNCNRRGKRRSTLPARRHEVNEFRAVDRQMPKAQTKIRDCRHSRKM